ncbi:increased loss of mitochondrial DNA protein 1 [Daldinia caldariorum]|uniref:increased loss of mitochondrial DNA protein 1 n=1 Tax=Daldinia caldariorum TaxID=326644 RepID=UPI002008CA39|nr:increased loss of mitochondrial DNA protein 1 [Daldinia caldariorum]KAI1465593.1 increased loss of mitochondrial DNA protein 1 [Daldinia caldariorum]
MALISVKTILTSLCLFHITLAYFFYTNPNAISEQALVFVLGEAMGMPQTTAFANPNPVSSLLGVSLLITGLSDLVTLSLPEEIWMVHYWGTQAPLRITIFASLSLFAYFSTPSAGRSGPNRLSHPLAPPAPFSSSSSPASSPSSIFSPAGPTGSDGLRNRVFFTFAFIEFLSWFWVWVTLKEEAASFFARKKRRGSHSGGGDAVR